MTKSDQEFVNAVTRWRNGNTFNDLVMEFIDEMVNDISNGENLSEFDDGFDACALMVNVRIKGINNDR